MPRSFTRLTRPTIRKIKTGEPVTERGGIHGTPVPQVSST